MTEPISDEHAAGIVEQLGNLRDAGARLADPGARRKELAHIVRRGIVAHKTPPVSREMWEHLTEEQRYGIAETLRCVIEGLSVDTATLVALVSVDHEEDVRVALEMTLTGDGESNEQRAAFLRIMTGRVSSLPRSPLYWLRHWLQPATVLPVILLVYGFMLGLIAGTDGWRGVVRLALFAVLGVLVSRAVDHTFATLSAGRKLLVHWAIFATVVVAVTWFSR